MNTILSAVVSALCFRFRRRASSNLSSSPFDIKLPCCGGSAQVGFDRDPVAPQGFPAVLAVAINIMLGGAAQGELRDP